MDLSELFSKIGEQAVKAALPKIQTLPGEPEGYFAVVKADGTVDVRESHPDWRNHKAHAIADFCAYVNTQGEYLTSLGEGLPVVWYSRFGAVAVLNDAESRRDRITLPLELSPQIRTLLELEALAARGGSFDQRQFVSLLRIKFAGCLNGDGLLSVIRNVKFATNAAGAGVVEHTKRSTGSSIESSITGAGAIPEEATLTVPIFVGQVVRAGVQCAIEVDPATAKFQLVPFPSSIENAIRYGETWLGEQLTEGIGTSGACYFGSP